MSLPLYILEVLVLLDFEGTMGDEITVHAGDVVKNVTVFSEEGWLEGELRGKRGIFPANFVKVWCVFFCVLENLKLQPLFNPTFANFLFLPVQEVPVYLKGDSKREPRSMRKSRYFFLYSPNKTLKHLVGQKLYTLTACWKSETEPRFRLNHILS